MDASEFRIYVSGFFDGEGSIAIARLRVNGRSDYHCIHVTLSQRSKYRAILDRVAAEYGGNVIVRQQQTRVKDLWAEQAVWQLYQKAKLTRFLLDVQPYCIVKERQVAIALEFLATFKSALVVRDTLGRIQGKILTADEIERREILRLLMREANELGPPRVKPSALPPLDVQHRQREQPEADRTTIACGEGLPQSKLTEREVREIRAAYAGKNYSQSELAGIYGVSLMAINKVVNHRTWQHVADLPDSPSPGPSPIVDQLGLFGPDA